MKRAFDRSLLIVPALVAAWSLAFRGFEGGRWSDIPIFKSFADPRLYGRDPFVSSLHDGTPAAYSYQLIGAVVGMLPGLPIEWPLFLLYVPACLASLVLLHLVALHLVSDRVSATLFLLLYVAGFRLFTVGSSILHSAELTPAFLALPLQLGAIYAMLRRRHLVAGVLAGVAMNVHAPTSSYVAAAIGLVYLIGIREYGLRVVAQTGVAMLACSSPTLLGALGQHAEPLPGWALQLARIELATDLSVAVNWEQAALRLRNLAGLGLLVAAMLAIRDDRDRRIVLLLFAAVALLCAVAFVFIDVSLRGPISTLVARLQFPRSVWLVNLLGLIYIAHYVRTAWSTGRVPQVTLIVLVATMLTAPSDFVPIDPFVLMTSALIVGTELGRVWVQPVRQERFTRVIAVATLVGAALLVAARLVGQRFWVLDFDDALKTAAMCAMLGLGWLLARQLTEHLGRGVAVAAALTISLVGTFAVRGSTDWMYEARHRGGLSSAAEFQEWARTQTPVDSVFLILPSEPNNESFYKNADRALFLMRERANQAVYFQEHNFEFRDRVQALGVSDVLRYREELDPAYRRLTEERIRELAARFGVTHFVPARAGDFSFPVIYRQGAWTVYQVPTP
jgi:hypothetical protein